MAVVPRGIGNWEWMTSLTKKSGVMAAPLFLCIVSLGCLLIGAIFHIDWLVGLGSTILTWLIIGIAAVWIFLLFWNPALLRTEEHQQEMRRIELSVGQTTTGIIQPQMSIPTQQITSFPSGSLQLNQKEEL